MSRRCLVLLSLSAAIHPPAYAQDRADATTERVLDNARAAIGPLSPEQQRKACRAQTKENEIVVCAPAGDDEFRVKSSNALDPTSPQATRDGVPRAPDLAPKYGGVKVLTGCILPPCPPPPMLMIDLSAIPETPKGSDAEKVANGEMRDR